MKCAAGAAVSLVLLVLLLAPSSGASAAANAGKRVDPSARRIGAWDRSVALERSGKLAAAAEVLRRGWGPTPDNYDVAVRLAWLAYRMGHYEEAAAAYDRAQTLEGANTQAARGLAYCRAALRAKSAIPNAAAQLWGGYLNRKIGDSTTDGFVVFAGMPIQLSSKWRARLAYRLVDTTTGTIGSRWHETYAGTSWDGRWLGFEALGTGAFGTGQNRVFGIAARERFGETAGLLIENAGLWVADVTNLQLAPTAYAWWRRRIALLAGARMTWQDAAFGASATLGLAVTGKLGTVHAAGYYGRERRAWRLDTPAVLGFPLEAHYGGTVTATVAATRKLHVGVQVEADRLEQDGARGNHLTISAGIEWRPWQ